MVTDNRKLFLIIIASFLLTVILPRQIFNSSGKLNPSLPTSLKAVSSIFGQLKPKPILQTELEPGRQTGFTVFPTGQIYVAPSIIVRPTQIIYPTAAPTIYLVDKAPINPSPTSVPLPTIIYDTPVSAPTKATPTYSIPNPTRPPAVTPTNPPQTNSTLADFGRCLTNSGMVMYAQNGCSSCTQQKNLLAEAYKYVTVVNCTSNPKSCSEVGLRTTPSWAKDNRIVIPGFATLDYLAQFSGCQLPR